MSRRSRTAEEVLDAYISTAPREALVRLQSEVNAALRYRSFDGAIPQDMQERRTRKPKIDVILPKDAAQLPLAAKGSE